MNEKFIKKLLELGFKKEIDNLYSFANKDKLYSTLNYWETFIYFENNKYFLSTNGDLVENFDAPDIDIIYMLEEIKKEIGKFGCYLDVSKIVKEVNINDFENELDLFTKAVKNVDKMYKDL